MKKNKPKNYEKILKEFGHHKLHIAKLYSEIKSTEEGLGESNEH